MVSRVSAKLFTVQLERVQKTATMSRVPFDLNDWVEEAKRPETRARRIAATVERLRQGRPQR